MNTTILLILLSGVFFLTIYFVRQSLKKRKQEALFAPYDQADRLSEAYFKVVLNRKCGVIDLSGNIIVPLEFDEVEIGSLAEYFRVAQRSDHSALLWGIYREYLLVPCAFARVDYSAELQAFRTWKTPEPDAPFGLYSLEGKKILEPKWLKIQRVNDLFLASYKDNWQDTLYEVFDRQGKTIIPESDMIIPFNNLFYVIELYIDLGSFKQIAQRAVYDQSGRRIIPFETLWNAHPGRNIIVFIGKEHFQLQDESKCFGDIYDLNGEPKYPKTGVVQQFNGYYCFAKDKHKKEYLVVDEHLNVCFTAESIFYNYYAGHLILNTSHGVKVIDQNQSVVHQGLQYTGFGCDNYVLKDFAGLNHLYYKGCLVYSTPYEISYHFDKFKIRNEKKEITLTLEGKKC